MKTEHISKPQGSLIDEAFLKHVLHIEQKDITLKFIFDHIKNYATCGALLWASVKILSNTTPPEGLPGTITRLWDFIAGGFIFALPWVLFALNFIQGIIAIFRLQNPNKINKFLYMVISFIVCITAIRFMLIIKSILGLTQNDFS